MNKSNFIWDLFRFIAVVMLVLLAANALRHSTPKTLIIQEGTALIDKRTADICRAWPIANIVADERTNVVLIQLASKPIVTETNGYWWIRFK